MAEKIIEWTEGRESGERDAWKRIDAAGVRALFDSGEWETCFADLLEYGEYETMPHERIILYFRADAKSAALREQVAELEHIETLRRKERSTYRAYAILVQARSDPARLAEAKAAWTEAATAYSEVEGLTKGGVA